MKALLIALLLISTGLAAQDISIDPPAAPAVPFELTEQQQWIVSGVAYGAYQAHIYHSPKIKRNCMSRDFAEVFQAVVAGMQNFYETRRAKYDEAGVPLAAFAVMHVIYPCMDYDKRTNTVDILTDKEKDIAAK